MSYKLISSEGYFLKVSPEIGDQIPLAAESLQMPVDLASLAQVLQVLRGETSRTMELEPIFLALGFEPLPKQALHFVPDDTSPRVNGSAGSLISLVARGIQNKHLDGKQYRKTYGKGDPRVDQQDDAYAESTTQLLDEPVRFGSTKQVRITRVGDGWSGLLARITLPALPQGMRWRSDVMEQVVRSFQLQVGGNLIYDCSGPINAAVCTAFNKWPIRDATRYVEQLKEEERRARSSKPWLIIVPLLVPPMWHDSNLIELISLHYHEVMVSFALASLADLVLHGGKELPVLDARVQIEADHVYMDGATRGNIAQGCIAKANAVAEKDTPPREQRVIAHEQCAKVIDTLPVDKHNMAREALQLYRRHVLLEEADTCALIRALQAEDLIGALAALSPTQQRICTAIANEPRVAQLWARYTKAEAALPLLTKRVIIKDRWEKGETAQTQVITASEASYAGLQQKLLPQIQWQINELDSTRNAVKRFPLQFNHPCAFLILVFRCDNDALMMEPDAHPFQRMTLSLNSYAFQSSDAIKAHEWNWKKCDALSTPAAHQKIYLLPFSKHALRWDEQGFPCTTNMSRLDTVTLEIEPNAAISTHWDVQIGTASMNVFRWSAGMGSCAYVN